MEKWKWEKLTKSVVIVEKNNRIAQAHVLILRHGILSCITINLKAFYVKYSAAILTVRFFM